ncbi:WG repeat-containing protein, partial [Bacteroides caecigallinarum]|uniref:WG repeat-containing protein n=1 Tax=Bacteroides caecigallinarum TaxID=1411144 RepID=UPI0019582A70
TSVGSGTPGYAPLEQANYHEGKDFPVTMDVYALGATMFKMLTGVRPPEASVILNDGFPAYELQKHHVGDALTACVGKAMAALRKDRPQSVEEFLKELQGNGAKTDNEEGTDYETTSDKKNVTEKDQKSPHKSGKKSQNILIGGLIGCLCFVGFIAIHNIINNHPASSEVQQGDTNIVQYTYQIDEDTILSNTGPVQSDVSDKNNPPKKVGEPIEANEQDIKYDKVWKFVEGMALVKRNGKYGYINKKKEEIVPCKYDDGWAFSNGVADVKLNGKPALINKKGIEIIPPVYDYIRYISGEYIIVCLNNKYGLFNINGEQVLPLKYEDMSDIFNYANGLFNDRPAEAVTAIKENGKWYYVDRHGRKIGKPAKNPDDNPWS